MNTTARQCPKCRATLNGSELACPKCGAAVPEATKYADLGPTVAMPGARTKGPPSEPSLAQDKLVSGVPVTADGRILGGVRLVRRIDHGHVAAIYLGHHLTLDMPVAVKVLSKAVQAYDATYITRFEREAKLSSKITHQNLVNTKNFGHEHGIFFLVMDLVEGQNAGKLIAKGPL